MIKFIFLILFILFGPIQAFAQNENKCIVALSHPSDKRIGRLSNEGQDIILMASLIASQLQPTTVSTIQLNPTLIFLGALTEVKIDSQEQGVFHNFSFIDGMLFTVLKRLGILEDTQAFLLNLLGFSNNNLGPFEMRPDGGVILHLDRYPIIPMATHFDYSETASALLDAIGRLTPQNVQEGAGQSLPTFSERLLLTVLELDIPLRSFLFNALNKESAIEVRSLLYPLFKAIKPTVVEPSEGLLQRLILEQVKITQRAVYLIQRGMSVPEAAERLGINQIDFQGWFDEYQQERGLIQRRQRRTRPRRK